MFLPSFPNYTLNLFLEAPYVPLVPSNHSLQCRQDIGHGSDWAEVGEGGLGPIAYNFEVLISLGPVSKLIAWC